MMLSPEQQAVDGNTSAAQLQALAQQNPELARLVAQNPNTTPNLLRQLAKREDPAIREAVASNPSTPTYELLELGAEFPKQVLANPVFSRLLLDEPDLPQKMPLPSLRQLVR